MSHTEAVGNFRRKPEILIPKMSQETLAEMIGTTRSRVSFFMNRFRKLASSTTTAGVGCKFTVHFSTSSSTTRTSFRKNGRLLCYRRTSIRCHSDGRSFLLGPQMSTGVLVERRAAGFASVEDPQHVGYEEDQKYGPQPYPRPPAISPAAMAVVPSTAP